MNERNRNVALWLAALFGVPIAFAAYVFGSYHVALRQGRLPITAYPEWYWYAAFAVSLAVGATAIYLTTLKPTWARVVLCILYAAAMTATLLGVHLLIACSSGDCL